MLGVFNLSLLDNIILYLLLCKVLGHLDRISSQMAETVTNTENLGAHVGSTFLSFPAPDFSWTQVLLQCLLRGQLILVRKFAMFLILS